MSEKTFAGLTYEQTLRKYSQTVAKICVMRLQNYADAEDCYQNTFLKLLTKSLRFSDENHLRSWLIRVAINECNDYLRKNKRLISYESLKKEPVSFNEDGIDMSWALLKTPQKYRDVLYLYYCERYRVKEIAEILKIKENTIKTLLKKGREILKSIYGGDQA